MRGLLLAMLAMALVAGCSSSAATAGAGSPIASVAMSPTTADGLPILSVSQVLAQRGAGGLQGGQLAVTGDWTTVDLGTAFCNTAAGGVQGWLDPRFQCGGWSRTITDPNLVLAASISPAISDTFDGDIARYDVAGLPGGQVAVVVAVGHFDDPLASECGDPAACRNRLVIDRIVDFTGGIAYVCLPPLADARPTMPPDGCLRFEDATRAAVADIPDGIARIEILPNGDTCSFPFDQANGCVPVAGGPAAYVYFAGTASVAALRFAVGPEGVSVATRVAFEVPGPTFHDPTVSALPSE